MQRTLENRTEFTRNGENQLGRWDYEAIQMLGISKRNSIKLNGRQKTYTNVSL